MELIDRSVTEIRDALERGAARASDLAEQWIARTDASTSLNCYVEFDADGLRRQAQAADALPETADAANEELVLGAETIVGGQRHPAGDRQDALVDTRPP